MSYTLNQRFLIGGLETTAGTMETLDGTDFDVRIRNPEVTPIIEWDDEASKFANGNHGEDEAIAGAQSATISFQVRLGLGDSVSTEPNYAKFFKACGLKENTYTTTGIGYQPMKQYDNKTMTIWVYDMVTGGSTPGALCYQFAGCMGNVTIGCEGIGMPIVASFSFTGKCVDIVDVAYASIPEGADFDAAHAEKMLNTSVLIGSVTGCISSWQLDAGNEISPLICQSDLTGYQYYQITNRQPRLSMNPLTKSVSDEDIWGQMISGLTGTQTLQTKEISITFDNIEFRAPKTQQIQANLANREGILNWDANYRCLANGWTGTISCTYFEPEVTWELLLGARE